MKRSGRTRMPCESLALGPGAEGFILALQRLRRHGRGHAVDGQITRTKSVENCPVARRQFGARIDAYAKCQPLMLADAQV